VGVVTRGDRIVYFDESVVTFDLAAAIAGVAPDGDRMVTVDAEARVLIVPVEERVVIA